jgi:hypothetical protein
MRRGHNEEDDTLTAASDSEARDSLSDESYKPSDHR